MTPEQADRLESLRRAVAYGLRNGKTNMIADIDLLGWLFDGFDKQRAPLKKTLISEPGSCLEVYAIEMPAEIKAAIAKAIEQGKAERQ